MCQAIAYMTDGESAVIEQPNGCVLPITIHTMQPGSRVVVALPMGTKLRKTERIPASAVKRELVKAVEAETRD